MQGCVTVAFSNHLPCDRLLAGVFYFNFPAIDCWPVLLSLSLLLLLLLLFFFVFFRDLFIASSSPFFFCRRGPDHLRAGSDRVRLPRGQ